MKKAVNNQVDETHSVDVNFFSQLPWFLLHGPTYRVAMVAGMGAIHSKVGRIMTSQRCSNSWNL